MNALVIISKAPNVTALTGVLETATYTSNTATMFDDGTSVSGKTLGAVVREDVTTISMSWRFLATEHWALINGLFKTNDKSDDKFVNKVRYNENDIEIVENQISKEVFENPSFFKFINGNSIKDEGKFKRKKLQAEIKEIRAEFDSIDLKKPHVPQGEFSVHSCRIKHLIPKT